MLIESFQISKSLRDFGLVVPPLHPWIKPLRKGDAIVIGIGDEGSVESVETVTAERVTDLSKIEKDNHNSFPAFNFTGPIWHVPADSPLWSKLSLRKIAESERARFVTESCVGAELAYSDRQVQRLGARLQEFAKELHPLFLATSETRFSAVDTLLRRITSANFDPTRFLNEFTTVCLNALRNESCVVRQVLQAILIGSWNARTKAVDNVAITAILDVADRLSMPLRVAHLEMTDHFNRVLMSQSDATSATATCCLTGVCAVLETDKLPSPKLPVLGNTILLSMNSDIPCHDRYGMIGAKIFPIGKDVATDVQSALLWITAPERAGLTWRPVPRNNGDGNDLLITYLDQDPSTKAPFADLFSEATADLSEARFEAAAKAVSEALNAQARISGDSILFTTVLRRINKGQVQVELTTQFTVSQIRRGYEGWIQAAANHPPFQLPIPQGKGKPAKYLSPWTPFPAEVMRSTQSAWLRRGTHRVSVTGLPLSLIYDIFLSEGANAGPTARTLLQRTFERASPLLIRCGHASHGRLDVIKDLSPEARQAALSAVSVLSIALFKFGSHKEEYMSQPAYLIGRMLSLADTLHFEYCKAMRKGQVPPQLLGNALIPMALVNPERSIAQLADRLRVYLGWAGTKGSGLSRWVLAQYGEVARDLSQAELDTKLDDAGKTQLLFGYLARPESKQEKSEGETNNV